MGSKKNVTYQCPFCSRRFNKEKLVSHVQNEHEDLLPEGFTPLRYVFNYVNRKPIEYHGICTECKGPTDWDENKGRYNRQCNNPKCKESFIKKFEANMVRTHGVSRISLSPEGQEKMLANRHISGKYKFKDGVEKIYTGSYERNALKFMDEVMNISSADIMAPGPVLEYKYNGEKHYYITDFLYIPYNLIIEVKDGGDRPNTRNMPDYRAKQIAKEEFIIKQTDYNYLRLTNNDLSQLLSVFADLKMQLVDNTSKQQRIIHVNESKILNEGMVKDEPDIYYNKDKFESGEINLCFITGHSGSGKSTMAHKLENDKLEVYELDDVLKNAESFSMENLKEYGNLIYSFFNGSGKKYYLTKDEKDKLENIEEYETKLTSDFISYSKTYAASHKNIKFIIEGIQIFLRLKPKELDNYAVYIKGTSALKSRLRATMRDLKNSKGLKDKFNIAVVNSMDMATMLPKFEKAITEWRNYYFKLTQDSVSEAMTALMSGYLPGLRDTGSVYMVQYKQNNIFSDEDDDCYGVTDDYSISRMIARDKNGILKSMPESVIAQIKKNGVKLYATECSIPDFSKKVAPFMNTVVYESFLYESVFGHECLDSYQIESDGIKIPTKEKTMDTLSEITTNFLQGKSSEYINDIDTNLCESVVDGSVLYENPQTHLFITSKNQNNIDRDKISVLNGLSIQGGMY